jgi:hypothetical protein
MIQVCFYFAPHKKGDEPINEPINVVLKELLELIKNNPGIKKTVIIDLKGYSLLFKATSCWCKKML